MPLVEQAQAPEISVIVPSYNSEKTIAACLQALTAQTAAAWFEIILVDSSNDRTPEIVRERFPRVRFFHLKEKTAPGLARNHGIARARGEILAFTDSDCIAAPDWLETIRAAHAGAYPVIGGGVRNAFPRHPISIAEFFLEFREFSVHSPRREIDILPTNNLSVRRAIFERFGVFSDLRASEDAVFIHQLRRHGVKVLFEPRICIRHMNRRAWAPFLRNQNILGKHSALARRLFPLPGAALAGKKWITPALPFIRTLRTLQFILMNRWPHNLRLLLEFLLTLPIFFLGACGWSKGFAEGMREPESVVQEMKEKMAGQHGLSN
jgi:glycosyltransferase involved in cell wall biosynthesis